MPGAEDGFVYSQPHDRVYDDVYDDANEDAYEDDSDDYGFAGWGRGRPARRHGPFDYHDDGASFDDDYHDDGYHDDGASFDDDYHDDGASFDDDYHDDGPFHHHDYGCAIVRKPERDEPALGSLPSSRRL